MDCQISQWLDENGRDLTIRHQSALTAIPALAPENGGQGECRKADYVVGELRRIGVTDIVSVDASDSRVSEGRRPNIVARCPGVSRRTLWIMGHLDVVPPGDPRTWSSDPFKCRIDGDRIYGRGTEDNQQAVVSMLLLAEAVLSSGIQPGLSLGLLFVADEECGSLYGIDHVLKTRRELFGEDDLVLVPDMGVPDGSLIEIAEKGILWLRVEVVGRQCHASTPHEGINTLYAASEMILAVPDMAARFPAVDPLFDRPSTFTATRHEENVPNVNTVPGRDVFYVDCRVLPRYEFDDVIEAFSSVFNDIAERHHVTVRMTKVQDTPAAPPTSEECAVVTALKRSVRRILGVKPRCIGVGGGTVAAMFRRSGIQAAVWGTQDGTMHAPDEYSVISHVVGDAKVFADILLNTE